MKDFERIVGDALKQVGFSYHPSDLEGAREVFLRRRRRRLFGFVSGGLALAGATAAIVFVFATEVPRLAEEGLPVVGAEKPTLGATVPVGDAPSGIAVGAGAVWVANGGDGTISKIDPVAGVVLDTFATGGASDDIAVLDDTVLVTDSERGRVIPVDPEDGALGTPIRVGSGGHLDIAIGRDSAWVVARDDTLYRIDPNATTPARAGRFSGGELQDVAAGRGLVYVADFPAGRLGHLLPPDSPGPFDRIPYARSAEGDLAATHDAVWVSSPDAGWLFRLDAESFDVTAQVEITGDYASVDVGIESVWLLQGNSDTGEGTLTRLDPATGKVVGSPLPLRGKPFDVRVGWGAVWVSHADDDSVTMFKFDVRPQGPFATPGPTEEAPVAPPVVSEPTPAQPPRATPTPTPSESPGGPPEIVPSPEPTGAAGDDATAEGF